MCVRLTQPGYVELWSTIVASPTREKKYEKRVITKHLYKYTQHQY